MQYLGNYKTKRGKSLCFDQETLKEEMFESNGLSLIHLRGRDKHIPTVYLCRIGFLCSRKGKDQLDLAMTDLPAATCSLA